MKSIFSLRKLSNQINLRVSNKFVSNFFSNFNNMSEEEKVKKLFDKISSAIEEEDHETVIELCDKGI